MDPRMPTKPRHWRTFKRTSLLLLSGAVAMGVGGWAGSTWGLDPAVAYRLAALLAAGGLLLGLMWISSAAMSEQGRGSGE